MLEERTVELAGLSAAVSAARQARDERQKAISEELDTLSDAFRAGEAQAGPEDDTARRAQLDALRARRDERVAELAPLDEALGRLLEVQELALGCVLRLGRSGLLDDRSWNAARTVWTSAEGKDLELLGVASAAALERLATPERALELRGLALAHIDRPTAVHMLAVATRIARSP
jgi:hypothetical protein